MDIAKSLTEYVSTRFISLATAVANHAIFHTFLAYNVFLNFKKYDVGTT